MNKNLFLKDNLDINRDINVYKHNVPSSREWANSVYSYNKNFLKNLPQNDSYLYNLIKTYLHLVPVIKTSSKSKRLRDSLTRNSSKQIFISKPEIKQTSDKVNIMLYLYNRELKISNKKAYYFNNMLSSIIKSYTYNKNIEILPTSRFTRKLNTKRKSLNRFDSFHNKHSINIYNNVKHYRNTVNSVFLYNFLRWSLSAFGFKTSLVTNKDSLLLCITCTSDKLNTINYKKSYKLYNKNLSIKNLLYINKILTVYLHQFCKERSFSMNILYNYYTNKYMSKFIGKYMKKQQIILKNLFKLQINKIKLGKIIVGLKSLVHNIYNKKIELNIVNLKYLHLNADILTEAIGIKLRNKNNNVLVIFKKAISLIKMPNISVNKNLFSSMNLIDRFKSFDINNVTNNKNIKESYKQTEQNYKNKDILSMILYSIFPYKTLNFISKFNTSSISNLLNTLYYKWVTGIRLQGKGRLTKRFTASRSVFKFRYRGSLKNLEHLNVPYYRKNTINSIMIRNQHKSNIQYAFTSDKKRVGVYGIKGWISNN